MVSAVERPLQAIVNSLFQRKDPYSVFRATVAFRLFVWLICKFRRIARHEGFRAYLVGLLAPQIKRLPPVRRKLDQEMASTMTDLRAKFSAELTSPRSALPVEGMPEEDLLKLVEERKQIDKKHWIDGTITGAVYHGGQEHYDFAGQFYAQWGFSNPLHPAIHPALRQMDSEVVQMVVNMYRGGPECCGAFTTGGTESILMAIKAYRDQGRKEKGIREPNIVVCKTAHAAFWKAGDYFNVFVKEARTRADQRLDVEHVAALIDGNTVAIVGSACTFAHGTIDPIEELGRLALRKGVGLHVDCCLGGFLVPFMEKAGFEDPKCDFRIPGVSSISCDPHKYGFAPKGASVVMFANRELRRHMYTYLIQWTGGLYGTATMTGSRAGGAVAATWATMCKFGEKGYVETTQQIVSATRKIAEGIQRIEGLRLVGRPEVCVVAFTGQEGAGVNCYAIADCLQKEAHWDLATCQNPPCIHLALTLPTSRNVDKFLEDLQQAVKLTKEDTTKSYSSTAGVYGMAASLPSSFLEDALGAYLDAVAEAIPPADKTET